MISNLIRVILFIVACASYSSAHATYPSVLKEDFNGMQGVIIVNNDNNQQYFAVFSKKKILFEQLQYKKQKSLSMRSKKLLLQYLRKKYKQKVDIDISRFMPVRYWEIDNIAYLISIINDNDITITSKYEKKEYIKDIPVEKQLKNIEEEKNIDFKPSDDNLSVDELKSLYMESLEKGDIDGAKKYFNEIKGNK